MFSDYYALLEIAISANQQEIKTAYRKQALKWHPDTNPGIDTNERMRLITEAYLMLKDLEARQKYDIQYRKFKSEQEQKEQANYTNQQKTKTQSEQTQQDKAYTHTNFEFDDELLKRWTENARKQSVSLAKQTIEDLKGMVKVGLKEGGKAMGGALVTQIIFSIIVMTILGLVKACN